MKITSWAILKVAMILVSTVPVALHRLDSSSDAHCLGMAVAMAIGFAATFQLGVWVLYDAVTLKRGGWIVPSFSQSPFARHSGPGLHLGITGVALLAFGFTKVFSTAVQGLPSLILGVWLIGTGVGLLIWQWLLRRLFQRRFRQSNGEHGSSQRRWR